MRAGKSIPVTVITAGPCFVTQIKNEENGWLSSGSARFQELKEKHAEKPQVVIIKKLNLKPPLNICVNFALLTDQEVKDW